MQSGYGTGGGGGSGGSGGVSEMQQFMVEGGCPSSSSTSIFSISTSNNNQLHPHHHHQHHHHPHHHHHHSLQPPPHFSHFQSIPITQQLFHQAHHPFQLFSHPHHPELGLDLESGPENSNSGAVQPGNGAPPPSFLTAAMSFKLGVNDNSSREDDGILHADDASDTHVHPWQREEESTIKEPFWRPLDIDYINNKRSTTNEKQQQQQQQQLQESSSRYYKKTNKEVNEQQGNNNGSNYKLFSELEAIYKPGNNNVLGGDAGGGGGGGSSSANNQTGSGSALTGDENPLMTLVAPGPVSEQRISAINQISDTSTGEEAAPMKKHTKNSGRRKRKRRQQQQLSSLTAFFENMVKQLMDHQEGLHRKFLQVIEKRDQDRMMREETWRKEEAAKNSRETALRAQERALASSREAAIISFLEKITGETLDLPTRSQFQSPKSYHHSHNEDDNAEHAYDDPLDLSQEFMNNNNNNNVDVNNTNQIHMHSSRWPKAEVHALIRVRSSLEMRFQEPGLKGPLWEEVSSIMSSMGYCRSSKRCKEKWENINKYFRKTKESGKKRPMHSKTCPYFYQLDQLYSKSSLNNNNNHNKLPPPPLTQAGDRKDNSELLDAIVLNNGHEDDDHQEHEGKEEEEEEEEEEDDGVKHQHHEHLFQSLDS